MHGNKKNGANREAKAEQNTVKPKQVKKMQSSPHDEKFKQAIKFATITHVVNATKLQKKLKIGCSRAFYFY